MKVKKAIAYVLAGVMMFEAAGLTASEQAQASVKGKLNEIGYLGNRKIGYAEGEK